MMESVDYSTNINLLGWWWEWKLL